MPICTKVFITRFKTVLPFERKASSAALLCVIILVTASEALPAKLSKATVAISLPMICCCQISHYAANCDVEVGSAEHATDIHAGLSYKHLLTAVKPKNGCDTSSCFNY